MNGCCSAEESGVDSPVIACPGCGATGPSVELRAVKAMLTAAALSRLETVSHRFCRSAHCRVVYYDERGQSFDRDEVRVAVWHKEPSGARTICYCFGESEASIRDEMRMHGSSMAVARVRAHIEAGRCACDVRNPRGVCCLGDLTKAVERVANEAMLEGLAR